MAPGYGVANGVSRIPGRLLEYLDLTPARGALRGWTFISLATRGNSMEILKQKKNRSVSGELGDTPEMVEEDSDREQAPVSGTDSMDFKGYQSSLCRKEGESSTTSELREKMENLDDLEKKEEDYFNALMQVIRNAEQQCKTTTNTQKDIKTNVELASKNIAEILKIRTEIREIKNKAQPEKVDPKIPHEQQGQIARPLEKRRREESTPSPNNSPYIQPRKKLQAAASSPWITVPAKGRWERKERDKVTEMSQVTHTTSQNVARGLRRKERPRPEAILISLIEGKKYADVLRDIKANVKPDDMGIKVSSIRETRKGGILVELSAKPEDKSRFSSALKAAVGEKGKVRSLVPRAEVDIRDLDPTTEKEEIKSALEAALEIKLNDDTKINMSRPNRWGVMMAFVELEETYANKLDEMNHIKIGWVNCRIRKRETLLRCFRCHGYGHMAAGCQATDRAGACWKCGDKNHQTTNCKATPNCYLCSERVPDKIHDHVTGSSMCAVYLDAKKKNKKRR